VLKTLAIWLRVVYQGVMIYVLLFANDCNTVQSTCQPFSEMVEVQIVSCQVSSERECLNRNMAFLFLRNVSIVNQISLKIVVLNFVVINNRSFLSINLSNRIGQHRILVQTLVTLDNLNVRV